MNFLTVGLDVGFGLVKAITPDMVLSPFPSVYGLAREIKFRAEDVAARYPGDQITDDEGEWWVGDLALSQLPQGELFRIKGRTADEKNMGNSFRVRLARVAIGKLLTGHKNGDAYHIRIATGLPVDHMRDAPGLKASLLGRHVIHTDSANIVANVTDVMVMPQPYGSIYAQALTETGDVNPDHGAESTGIVDIGTYTIDLALDKNGEYIDAESGSAESGVYTAQERIAILLERDLREKPKPQDVEQVLRTGRIKIRGKWQNYDSEVEEALEPLRRATLSLMNEKWRTGARVDVIYLSGGGASLVEDQVKAAFPQTVLLQNSQLANARGYLNYALLAEKNAGLDNG